MARKAGSKTDGGLFDVVTIETVWQKGKLEPNYANFRKDACGASMERQRYGMQEEWGWEIDHINPAAKGGTDDLSNLQPLQWENNRHKGDNYPHWDCKVKS